MSFFGGLGAGFFDTLVGGINSTLSFLWGVLKGIVKALAAFRKHLWETIVKKVLPKLLDLFTRLKGILTTIFNIAWQILDQLRFLIDYIYKHFVRPYLIMIQRVRQVLTVFRLLGFKWARRLDARLAALEAKIISVFLLVRAPINQIISFLGLLADPLAILRRNPVIAAVLRDAAEIKNAIDRATAHPQTQAEVNASNEDNGWFQVIGHRSPAIYFGGFDLPHCPQGALQEFKSALAELVDLAKQEL